MRRLKILFFWIFVNKNNVTFRELLKFLVKPKIDSIANTFIKEIISSDEYLEISFNNIDTILFWPKNFSLLRLYQVVCESFDENDWHFYQKRNTEVNEGEIILDIGTAEGLFPLDVIEKCSHIYMIEPSKIFNNALKKTFSKFSEKTTIYHTAVGNFVGQIPFDENSLEGMISENNDLEKVCITTIDSLIGEKKITYLKADIEGYELEMLKGSELTIKTNKPKIAITTYHTQNNPTEIINLIKSFVPEYNYYVKGIYEKTPKPVMIHFWI